MNQPISEAAVAQTALQTTNKTSDKIRLGWFALGCSCLVIGSFYLSNVELSSGPATLAETQEAVTAAAQ